MDQQQKLNDMEHSQIFGIKINLYFTHVTLNTQYSTIDEKLLTMNIPISKSKMMSMDT